MKSSNISKYGSLFIRLVVALIFITAGYAKLFGGMDFAGMLGNLGFPIPAVLAMIVALAEFVGGILLFVNVWTNYVSWILGIIMIVALFTVHVSQGWNGMQQVILLIATLVYFGGKTGYNPFVKKSKYCFV